MPKYCRWYVKSTGEYFITLLEQMYKKQTQETKICFCYRMIDKSKLRKLNSLFFPCTLGVADDQ